MPIWVRREFGWVSLHPCPRRGEGEGGRQVGSRWGDDMEMWEGVQRTCGPGSQGGKGKGWEGRLGQMGRAREISGRDGEVEPVSFRG